MSDLHCAWCGAEVTPEDTYIAYRGLHFDTEKCYRSWQNDGWRLAAKHREAMERREGGE